LLDNLKISIPSTAGVLFVLLTGLILSACASNGKAPSTTQSKTPTQPSNWPASSVAAFSKGVQALGADNELARISFAEAIEIAPQMEPAYYNLVKLDFDQKNYEAVDNFQKQVQKNNLSSARLNNLFATSKRLQYDFASAQKLYLTAIQIDPSYTPALLNLAILNDVYLGNISAAKNYYLLYQQQLELQGKQDNRLKNWITDIQRRLSTKNGEGQ
jgi:tetratricopeptide (TPR) repeat protein